MITEKMIEVAEREFLTVPEEISLHSKIFLVLEAAEQARWQDIEDAPKDKAPFLIRAEHWKTKGIIHCVGHFGDDGFYMEDGSELSFNYNPTHFQPLPTMEGK